jgi:hypothetical protein
MKVTSFKRASLVQIQHSKKKEISAAPTLYIKTSNKTIKLNEGYLEMPELMEKVKYHLFL